MPDTLFDSGKHKVLLFTDMVAGDGGVQCNQLFIYHAHHAALFDPGGQLTFQPLQLAITEICPIRELDYVIASHQDPDIISSLDRWLMYSHANIFISRLWERFLPHLVPGYMSENGVSRIVGIPDQGMDIQLGDSIIKALPAHFLHSVGNFSFYDPVSKILFSGDVGASMPAVDHAKPVDDFASHVSSMQGFHQRYMGSNQACRLWVNMVRQLDVEMIVPQHGRHFVGKAMITQFLDWFSELKCGIDLIDQSSYQIP
ncbi:MAG: FprA family A-type flavoprotein [Halobacteria archaeon]|nr:FprA family A-type flavoprotein [Halobacteria archaeon]